MNATKVLLASVLVLCAQRALTQPFSIDRFTIAGGGGTSTGGTFELSGTVGQPEAGRVSDSRYTIEGGFWSFAAADAQAVAVTTIFNNTNGIFNGHFAATTTTWLAGKFCLGPQPYQLESVALPLDIFDLNVRTSTVRLQIFSNDPASGKPSVSTGVAMNLSGLTNPITILPSSYPTLATWTPATPFTLAANQCYWAVLSVESGASVWLAASATMPIGDAGVLGRASSGNAGTTWGVPDTFYNHKMLIRGTAAAMPPALALSAVSLSGNELRFSFPTRAGQTYAIESRDGLAGGAWAEIPGTRQTSAGAALEVSLPIRQSQPQQFYRVKQLP
jgi:hypothetical protein